MSQWIYSSSGVKSTQSYLEGSPIDRAIFTFLILIGAYILFQRRLNWGKIIKKNYWVWCFFLFGIISVLWSDYPDVSIKRWIKALGNVIMVLIILSEEQPYKAAGFLIRRLAFILVPLSVLLIKYYPSLGRVYHRWTYEPMFIGVTTQKR